MTVPVLQLPRTLTVDANGAPRSGAKLYVFAAQTTDPVQVWQDAALTIPHAVPIGANTEGTFPPIYPDPELGDLKINITDENDIQIPGYPIDNIPTKLSAGSVTFTSDDIAPLINPRTSGEISAGVTPVNYAYPAGYISRYGNNTVPGVTDMSAVIQQAIDANKGGIIYIDSRCLAAGILLKDSPYNGTEIRCVGAGEIVVKPNAGQFNFDTSIWGCLIIQGCDRILLDLRINGNRSNMTQTEAIYCVAICGSTNVYCPSLKFREIRGDGLYIDWYSPIHNSAQANSKNIVVDYLSAYNTDDDGRQACSVISCDGLSIGELHSFQVGGVVNSINEPGGLDLEPNWAAQSITDVTIGMLNVVTAGAFGFQIFGHASDGVDANRDWNIQRVTLNGGRVRYNNGTSGGVCSIARCRDVTFNIDLLNNTVRNNGCIVDYADRINGTVSTRFVQSGLVLGLEDFVNDSNFTAYVWDYGSGGVGAIRTGGVARTTIKGKVYSSVPSVNAVGIQLTTNGGRSITQTAVVYSLDFPYDANVVFIAINGGVTVGVGTCLKDCNMLGFLVSLQTNFQIPSYNCAGRNYGTGGAAAPTNGTWAQFDDETVLDQTAGSTAPRAKCIAGGSPGTWKTYPVMSA